MEDINNQTYPERTTRMYYTLFGGKQNVIHILKMIILKSPDLNKSNFKNAPVDMKLGMLSAAFRYSKNLQTIENSDENNPFSILNLSTLKDAANKFSLEGVVKQYHPFIFYPTQLRYKHVLSKSKIEFYGEPLKSISPSILLDIYRLVQFGWAKTEKHRIEKMLTGKQLDNHQNILYMAISVIQLQKKHLYNELKKNSAVWKTFQSGYPNTIIVHLPEPFSAEFKFLEKYSLENIGERLRMKRLITFSKAGAIKKNKVKKSTNLLKKDGGKKTSLWLKNLAKPSINREYITVSSDEYFQEKGQLTLSDNSNTRMPNQIYTSTSFKHSEEYKETLESNILRRTANNWEEVIKHYSNEETEKPQKIIKKHEVISRHNQSSFRVQVLSLFSNQCCVTGTTETETLEAAHIKDWSVSKNDDPTNGLCLRSDIHRLFDKGLLDNDDKFCVQISSEIKDAQYKLLNGKKIHLPEAQLDWPKKEFLLWRLNERKNEISK